METFNFFLKEFNEVILTKSSIFKAQDLTGYSNNKFLNLIPHSFENNSIKAYKEISSKLDDDTLLVITGSIFLVGEILEYNQN